VFPNPAANQLMLQTNMTGSGATWNIKNILGQTLASGSIESAQTAINVSSFTSGIYFAELQQGATSITKKLVVSR
jgi:hypothetical protein